MIVFLWPQTVTSQISTKKGQTVCMNALYNYCNVNPSHKANSWSHRTSEIQIS